MAGEDKADDLTASYTQKFWDAGNLVVTLMFALAFGVYTVLAGSPPIRCLAAQNFGTMVWLALFGNFLLAIVLIRLNVHERRLSKILNKNAIFDDALRSALHIRMGMLVFNTALYLGVLTLVEKDTTTKTCSPAMIASIVIPI